MQNRKIAFRAWDKKEKMMWDNFWLMNDETDGLKMHSANGVNEPIEKNPASYILMQFTGLTDKNGILIFEGDIVKTDWDEIGAIRWSNAHYWVVRKDKENKDIVDMFNPYMADGTNEKKFEVIGNIWENPELLKKTE